VDDPGANRTAGAGAARARRRPARLRAAALAAALALFTAAAFLPVLRNGFIGVDDPDYVTGNPRVLAGPTPEGIAWAFTSVHSFNWHPLTWVSHMVDARVFGLAPAGHHATSLLLHAANAALLFWLLLASTGAAWRSLAVAALFAVHPLRVESVAWVAERKDVLSACLGLAALLAWVAWVRRPRPGRYAAALALFALGLLAKPMLVTLPFVLLLLDYWPLARWRSGAPAGATARRLAVEKLPWFALAAASSVVTYRAQAATGAVRSLGDYPLWVRAANAPLAAAGYLRRELWPAGLAMPYPHPGLGVDVRLALVAAVALAVATAAALALRRRRPAAAVGWLWFLGTLFPVLGLVQVAGQGLADRYTYLPLIGPVVGAVWLAADALRRAPRARVAAGIGCALLCVALAALSWRQSGLWRDDLTLFRHAVAADPGNWMARTNLGAALVRAGRAGEALAQLETAVRDNPDYPDARYNLGVVLLRAGRPAPAATQFAEVLRRLPYDPDAHNNLGIALVESGRPAEAIAHYELALRVKPQGAEIHNNLGVALWEAGRKRDAVAHYRRALELRPDFPEARRNLQDALAR
jgi:Flp pilus assembly protein TadD